MHRNRPWLRFIIDPSDGAVGGGGTPPPNDPPTRDDAGDQLGDGGKKALDAERETNKQLRADLKAMKAQVGELTKAADAKSDADKSDAQRASAAEQRASEAEARAAANERTLAGLAAGLDLALAKRLTCDDPDELAAEIEELKPYASNGPRKPAPNEHQGQRGGDRPPALDTVAAGRELYRKTHPAPK